ncbi:MAG: bifunctional hydroxymethylpyrimidine kinase/phosphomethylpyrimidine kinase [Treponema sp.]|jgi:pyridoxine kinase|nr:bifunctional hydroxymethylpyrimidine kinase/phosphomethylpyrimidine kinase [Treponema sp.]
MIKIATIAGSDASGGAGLEADLKTFEEYGLYGMAAVTVIATMDPANEWAHSVYALPEDVLRFQMETIFKGVGVSACKSGMLGTEYAVEIICEYIKKHKVNNYVLDPVMVCKGANEALNPELNSSIAKKLLPLAKIVTPNLFEAAQLAGMKEVNSLEQMEEAAQIIFDKGAKNVFIKGGAKLPLSYETKKAIDIFYDGESFGYIENDLIDTKWTHGAGCTTAAAIVSGLARGLSPVESVVLATQFINESLRASFPLNKWVGAGNPTDWRKDRAIYSLSGEVFADGHNGFKK